MLAALLAVCLPTITAPAPIALAQGVGNPLSISPEEEAKIGREQHEQVLAKFGGAYQDPKLQAYVKSVGERLLAVTPRKGERFTFTLLDTDVVNAFALPGGYVYTTRGLLALARDEAELAGVLGHEIGHVVARHPAGRYNRGMLGQLGTVGAQVLGGLLGGYFGGDVGARLGTQLGAQGGALAAQAWVQGYSREQEFEADQLGIQYLEAAGYEPRAMASFLEQLQGNDKLQAQITGQSREGGLDWFRSHPRTTDRVTRAAEAAAAATPGSRAQHREQFLAAIDGMIYGEDPSKTGFIQGSTFEHPALGFRFTAPPGFTLTNTPDAVLGKDGQGRAMRFDMAPGRSADPATYLRQEFSESAAVENIDSFRIGSAEAASGITQVKLNGRPAEAVIVAIQSKSEGQFYRFAFADSDLSQSEIQTFEEASRSFQTFPPGNGTAAPEGIQRLAIHTVRSGETQEDLAKMMAVEKAPLETFRLINGLEAGQPLRPGDPVKLIVRG
jgi:predicted Zn-dependent protease